MPKPLFLRQLKAEMALKDLTLRSVAKKAGVTYSTASELLNGTRIDPERLNKLSTTINRAPMPQEAAA